MKLTHFALMSVAALAVSGVCSTVFAQASGSGFSETPSVSGFQLVLLTVVMASAFLFIVRQRKAPAMAPIKKRRNEVIIVRRSDLN